MNSEISSGNSARRSDKKTPQSSYEEYLKNKSFITVEDIQQLKEPTSDYLVSRDANIFGIFFTRFCLRDEETNKQILNIKLSEEEILNYPTASSLSTDPSFGRFIRFQLPPSFLEMKHIGATIDFKIGNEAVKCFRMVEKHYFDIDPLKEFEFLFPFCMPNSRNSCDQIYEVPALQVDLKAQMIKNPYLTKSDSFYFVQNRLVMHHKAEFDFNFTS
ncbi:hypothetical protein LOD99_5750 [Oopsacas minuta]|uniref:GMP phosphodiesterase delta subunit domain-containing protein n=1 Tax=Oopsacas minuta TaxID=111878 RepID=A0AAV7JPT1_9METZ|nr:hypothetical protein LOD99_5750 [Oopsacas minuta]